MKKRLGCLALAVLLLVGCGAKNDAKTADQTASGGQTSASQSSEKDLSEHPYFYIKKSGNDVVITGVKPSNGYLDWLKENHGKIEVPNGVTVIDGGIIDYEGITEIILPDTVYKLGRRSLDSGFEVTHYRYPNRAVEIDPEFSNVGIMPGVKNVAIELPENFSITNIDKLVATERAQGIEASKVVFYYETLGYIDDPNNVIPVVTVKIHKGSWADQHKQQLIPQKQGRASMAKFEIEYVD